MNRLFVLLPIILGACSTTPGGGNGLIDLKDDPNSGCATVSYLGTAGGLLGHLGENRKNDALEINLNGCKITPVYPPPTSADVAAAVMQALISAGVVGSSPAIVPPRARPLSPVAPVVPLTPKSSIKQRHDLFRDFQIRVDFERWFNQQSLAQAVGGATP